jgi:Tfp pilus assembly protein PilF
MPSHLLRIRNQTVSLATLLALGLSGGCATTGQSESQKKAQQPSGSILTTEPSTKVTNQQSADVWIALGRSLEDEGKAAEARSAYLSAIKNDPKRADAEARIAILEDRAANPKEADRHFAQAIKLDPKNSEILCDRGYSLYQRNFLKDAETTLRQAIMLNPLHQRSHNNLALVLAHQGDTQGALQEFARAGCDKSDAFSNLALALAMQGKFDESKKLYVKALAEKPNSTNAAKGIEATVAALAGQGDPTAIATRVARPPTPTPNTNDPAIMRTSGQTGTN